MSPSIYFFPSSNISYIYIYIYNLRNINIIRDEKITWEHNMISLISKVASSLTNKATPTNALIANRFLLTGTQVLSDFCRFETRFRQLFQNRQDVVSWHLLTLIFQTWCKPIMGNFKVHWNTQNGLSMTILNCDLFHCTVHHPTKFQADIWRPWRCPSNLIQAYHGKFQVPWNTQNCLGMAILNFDLLHGTVHHPTKFWGDIWRL